MREIEVKFKVENLSSLENQLKKDGCILSQPINQHDIIYSRGGTSEWESAKEGDIILRIRNQNDKIEFNLKQQKSSELDNLEFETEVKDAKALDNILRLLGWHPEVEVKKIRKKGKLGEYEICLDNVEGLGTYVELEKLTDDNVNPIEIQEELMKFLERLGISRYNLEVRGYDTMIFQLRNK